LFLLKTEEERKKNRSIPSKIETFERKEDVFMGKTQENRGERLGRQLTTIIRRYAEDPNFARLLEEDLDKALGEFRFEPRQKSGFQIVRVPSECSCGKVNQTCEGVGCPNWVIGVRYADL